MKKYRKPLMNHTVNSAWLINYVFDKVSSQYIYSGTSHIKSNLPGVTSDLCSVEIFYVTKHVTVAVSNYHTCSMLFFTFFLSYIQE